MPVHDDLGTRMKEFYENVPKTRLVKRTPVAIRIDGKAFHTFTRGFQKPFDDILIQSMQETTKYLCENIQGCVFGYTQSDEITLILIDYKKLTSSAWFDYEVQKMCSIAASMATMAFNRIFNDKVWEYIALQKVSLVPQSVELQQEQEKYNDALRKAKTMGAMFDARCFNIPKEEVTNLVYWRQLDATRNSIQMVGQANFSHKELQNKSCNMIQDMLHEQKGINWNDFSTVKKRGTACIYTEYVDENNVHHVGWTLDYNMPILKGEGRQYLDMRVNVGEGM